MRLGEMRRRTNGGGERREGVRRESNVQTIAMVIDQGSAKLAGTVRRAACSYEDVHSHAPPTRAGRQCTPALKFAGPPRFRTSSNFLGILELLQPRVQVAHPWRNFSSLHPRRLVTSSADDGSGSRSANATESTPVSQ